MHHIHIEVETCVQAISPWRRYSLPTSARFRDKSGLAHLALLMRFPALTLPSDPSLERICCAGLYQGVLSGGVFTECGQRQAVRHRLPVVHP